MRLQINTRGLHIPFVRMGKVTSEDLFEEREQAVFDFYERHAKRYARALDVGANLGIHAILMARAGWEVRAFEPDPEHYGRLVLNLAQHGVQVDAIEAAVSTAEGTADFVRVAGNGTANHLAGARSAHGKTQQVRVRTMDCRPLFDWADFAKIDCEGHEAALLATVTRRQRCEFMVEVGTPENAAAIFAHFNGWRPMWAQASGWGRITRLQDMPAHYRDGALFIGEEPCRS